MICRQCRLSLSTRRLSTISQGFHSVPINRNRRDASFHSIANPQSRTPNPEPERSVNSSLPQCSPAERIAVIGGGISGLATAYFLSRKFPHQSIELFEASNRYGGWIESHKLCESKQENDIYEQGPQSIRVPFLGGKASELPPYTLNGLATLKLVCRGMRADDENLANEE